MMPALVFAALLAGAPPSPERQSFFEAAKRARLASRPAPPARSPRFDRLPEPRAARVEAWFDDLVRVSWALEPAQLRLLRKRRVPEVEHVDEIAGEAIFRGRLHRVLPVGPDLRGPAGEALFERLQGRDVTLVLGRASTDGHLEVLDAR